MFERSRKIREESCDKRDEYSFTCAGSKFLRKRLVRGVTVSAVKMAVQLAKQSSNGRNGSAIGRVA